MKLPKARNENIIMQNLETEVLIYDTIIDKAYCLNETSANIFNHCDGATSFDELKRRYKYTDEFIFLALDGLIEKNLIDNSAQYQSPFAGMNRREAVRKVGLASMVALPLISSIVAPTALNAASGAAAIVCIPRGAVYCPAVCRAGGTVTYIQYATTNGTCQPTGGFYGDLSANCGPGGNDVGRTNSVDLSIRTNNC